MNSFSINVETLNNFPPSLDLNTIIASNSKGVIYLNVKSS